MKSINRKHVLSFSIIALVLAALIATVALAADLIQPGPITPITTAPIITPNPNHYTIQPSDYTDLTEEGLLAMYRRAGEIVAQYETVDLRGTQTKEGLFDVVMARAEAGIPYAASAFRASPMGAVIADTDVVTSANDTVTVDLSSNPQNFSDQQLRMQYLVFLAILDLKPEYYDYTYRAYFDDPNSYYRRNWWGGDDIVLCSTYASHGYDSVWDYYQAILDGTSENHGDIFLVNISRRNVRAMGDSALLQDLIDVWDTQNDHEVA